MATGSAAEVQERFERIISGLASPLPDSDGRLPGSPLQPSSGVQPSSGEASSGAVPGASGPFDEPLGRPRAPGGEAGPRAPLLPSTAQGGPPPSMSMFEFSFSNAAERPGFRSGSHASSAAAPEPYGMSAASAAAAPAERPGFADMPTYTNMPSGGPPPGAPAQAGGAEVPMYAAAAPAAQPQGAVEDPFLTPPTPPRYLEGHLGPDRAQVPQAGGVGGVYTPSGRMPEDGGPPPLGQQWYSAGGGGPPEEPPPDYDFERVRHKRSAVLLTVESTMRVFPAMFSFFCLATFSMPIWITYHIGEDENVKQWISTRIWLVLLLFVPYAVAHGIHQVKGHPVRLVLVVCLVGSAVVLLLIGDYVLLKAYNKSNEFYSQDCDTFPEKRELELEWQAARVFYANCAASKASSNNITFNTAVQQFRIQSCDGYEDHVSGAHPDWNYLGFLEETYRCSGWCREGEPMWTFASTSDACCSAVADVMYNKIQWSQMQVVLYTIAVLGFVSTTLITVGPILVKLGIEW